MRANTVTTRLTAGALVGIGLGLGTFTYEHGAHIGEVGIDGHVPGISRELDIVNCQIGDITEATRRHPYTGPTDCETKYGPDSPYKEGLPMPPANTFVDPDTSRNEWIISRNTAAGRLAIRRLNDRADELATEYKTGVNVEVWGSLGLAVVGTLVVLGANNVLTSRIETEGPAIGRASDKTVPQQQSPAPSPTKVWPDEMIGKSKRKKH